MSAAGSTWPFTFEILQELALGNRILPTSDPQLRERLRWQLPMSRFQLQTSEATGGMGNHQNQPSSHLSLIQTELLEEYSLVFTKLPKSYVEHLPGIWEVLDKHVE